jgi:hypothetical protein
MIFPRIVTARLSRARQKIVHAVSVVPVCVIRRSQRHKSFRCFLRRQLARPLLVLESSKRTLEASMMYVVLIFGSLVILLGWLRAIEGRFHVSPQQGQPDSQGRYRG